MSYGSREQINKGFTITELSFAVTGLSVLLIILLISVINITGIYNKGLILKQVNQAGTEIGKDVQESFRTSQQVTARIDDGIVTGICTDRASYVWSVQSETSTSERPNNYSDGTRIGFARVSDDEKSICTNTGQPTSDLVDRGDEGFSTAGDARRSSVEMLSDNLSLRYSGIPLEVGVPGSGTGRGIAFSSVESYLSTFTYTIATNDGEAFIIDDTGRSQCRGDKEGEFCALNTFTVTGYSRYGNR